MTRDEEFSAYADARWPILVRSAVLLGWSRPDAEDLVQTALLRCYLAWAQVSHAADRDAYVYRILVNAHHDSQRRSRWGERHAAGMGIDELSLAGFRRGAIKAQRASDRSHGYARRSVIRHEYGVRVPARRTSYASIPGRR